MNLEIGTVLKSEEGYRIVTSIISNTAIYVNDAGVTYPIDEAALCNWGEVYGKYVGDISLLTTTAMAGKNLVEVFKEKILIKSTFQFTADPNSIKNIKQADPMTTLTVDCFVQHIAEQLAACFEMAIADLVPNWKLNEARKPNGVILFQDIGVTMTQRLSASLQTYVFFYLKKKVTVTVQYFGKHVAIHKTCVYEEVEAGKWEAVKKHD